MTDKRRISEVELDHALAEGLADRSELLALVLQGGRFDRFASTARILQTEQAAARPKAKHWWKHWWCRLPDGSESETDIFVVLEAGADRFALHIENKPLDGKLSLKQAVDYRRRAALKANDFAWLNYTDFECILVCPSGLAIQNDTAAQQFDRVLPYESIAQSLPLFEAALTGGRSE